MRTTDAVEVEEQFFRDEENSSECPIVVTGRDTVSVPMPLKYNCIQKIFTSLFFGQGLA